VTRKLPDDAFAFYVALGLSRSYDTVAKHYHVHKRTVVRTVEREEWAKRLQAIERKAQEVTDSKLADDLHEMNLRHRKMMLAMAARAANALQSFPLRTGMEAIKAAECVIKLERLMVGQPTEQSALTVE
jgi:hypothetical protein